MKSRLSAISNVRLTKITFFDALPEKGHHPLDWFSRSPRHLLMQMMKRHSPAGLLCPHANARRKCWGIGATGVCADEARGTSLVPPGEKRRWVVRKWYVRFLMALEARCFEACRISRANFIIGATEKLRESGAV